MTGLESSTPHAAGHAPARVVIAVNPPGEYARAIDAAARLALRLEARLEAVMVEDSGLLELARMPLTRVIDRAGRDRSLDDRTLQRAWRVERRRLDEALRRCASGLKVHASLRVVQGRFVSEALSVAAEVDVTLLAQSSSLTGALTSSERSWLRTWPGARRGPDTARRARPVWVLYDGSPASGRALAFGAQLASEYRSDLLVLHSLDDAGERAIREQVRALVGGGAPGLTLVRVAGSAAQVLTALRRPEGCALVLAPRDALDAPSVPGVLEALALRAYPLVLVA